MVYKYAITILFLLSLVSCSFFSKRRIFPQKPLKIDRNEYRAEFRRPFVTPYPKPGFMLPEHEPYDFESVVLHKFYEMAETGSIGSVKLFEVSYEYIFERNKIYIYTPAEWALKNGKMNIFNLFITEVLLNSCPVIRYDYLMNNLLTLAIQYNNLEAVRTIIEKTQFKLDGKGFLAIAAQHHSSKAILKYLLDDCYLGGDLLRASPNGIHAKPLEACIRFNNLYAATLFLRRRAHLGARRNEIRSESPLALIFKLDKKRMLSHILTFNPYYCTYSDDNKDGILHYAAMYAKDPEMISLILESCPRINIDSVNERGVTPLFSNLQILNYEKSNIAIKFIKMGAHLMSSLFNHLSPLEVIVKYKFNAVFDFIVDNLGDDKNLMKKLVEIITEWPLLEKVLQVHPNIPRSWINPQIVNLNRFLEVEDRFAFKQAIKLNLIKLNPETLDNIIKSGKTEFLKLAFEAGADPKTINDLTMKNLVVEQNHTILECISQHLHLDTFDQNDEYSSIDVPVE